MRAYKWLWIAVVLLAIHAGCVSLEAPKTFNDKLAYGYASLTASRSTATDLLQRQRIAKDEAVQIQALADQTRSGLDLARGTALKGDMVSAQGQLDLALSVLTQLEAYLKRVQ